MFATLNLALLAAIACSAVAQQSPPQIVGYGFQPCTSFDANNMPQPDPTVCRSFSRECVIEPETGFYFCGIKGATCRTSELYYSCDYGRCENQKCTGGLGEPSDGSGLNCLGRLNPGNDGNCGSDGANCGGRDSSCVSAFCGSTSLCRPQVQVGDTCLTDDDRACGPSLYAWRDHAVGTCTCQATPPPTASQRARARRTTVSLCPASYIACPLGIGFECVDTQSNLERCGGCNDESGGVDCTALPGIEAVGCVDGRCEIWACATGFRFDAQRNACVAL